MGRTADTMMAFPGGIRKISTSKGCRSLRSVDSGLRPNASEISLPAPLNFPFGEHHVSSAIFVVLTLFISEVVNAKRKPREAAAKDSRMQFERNGCLPLAPRSGS